jgi:hypothetical protein
MKFRWSGATACDVETAAARLNDYFSAVGYRTLPPDLRWARGSLWKALLTMSPRQLPIIVEAKVQPWGAQTLVDVTFDFPRSVRALSEQDADLIVAELRGLTSTCSTARRTSRRCCDWNAPPSARRAARCSTRWG